MFRTEAKRQNSEMKTASSAWLKFERFCFLMSKTEASFGDRIARLRRTRGWTQAQLAERVAVKAGQISKYERGDYEPRLSILTSLAAVLETSTDFLLTGRETRPDRLLVLWPLLERLPVRLRNALADFLESVLRAHSLLLGGQTRE